MEDGPPPCAQQPAVALDTGPLEAGEARGAAHVLHDRTRLVDHAPLIACEAEAEVDILAVHGREARIEPSHRDERGSLHEQAGGRGVVHRAAEQILGSGGDVTVAVVANPRIAPDDGPGLLESPVG